MRALLGMATVVCIGSVAFAQEKDARILVAEANRAFASGDHAVALEAYKTAELTLSQSPELAYNQGAAYYKLGDYGQARDVFNRAPLRQDLGLEAKAKFNPGNVAYAAALRTMPNPLEAIDLLTMGIGHCRDALELDPRDDDARINIEAAQLLIKDLRDKLKQQQERRRQQCVSRQDQEEDKQGRQHQGRKQGTEQDERQERDPQNQQQRSHAEQQQAQWLQQADEEMTAQEAKRLLQAVRDKERRRCAELARRRHTQRTRVAKDW